MRIKKLVLFGAGKIGRSFIGQLFSRGGYEVVFIDIYKQVIDALNEKQFYNVIIKSDTDTTLKIRNVRGVWAEDKQAVINEIASADLLAVSIGQNGLPMVMPLIAAGLLKRFESLENTALDIIIAENLRNAANYFFDKLSKLLPRNYPIRDLVGLVETSIGKMVPIMLKKDIEEDLLQVFAEPYNNLILDELAFKNPIPKIDGLSPKKNMKAWVDRKLFVHNLGHAATAYFGYSYNPDFVYLYEALEVPEIIYKVKETMLQSADLLLVKYPDEFTRNALVEHIDDLLARFQNKALGDTIFRVGSDLLRKLSKDDRLVGAINLAIELDMPYDKIQEALFCAFQFRAKDENGLMLPADLKFIEIYNSGVEEVLATICGLNPEEILSTNCI